MIKSPLRYPGGKSRGVKVIKEYIPQFREFREVFFGGGSLTFHYQQLYPENTFLGNDLNFELFCFWNMLKNNGDQLINSVQEIYNEYRLGINDDDELYRRGKELFRTIVGRRNDDLTEIERGVDFFVLNRITFSGVVDSGGYSNGSFKGRFTQSSIERLKTTRNVIEGVEFHCEDYSELITREGNDVLIFLDPPYHSATKSKLYGRNGILHTEFNHERLFEFLNETNHNWIMTYDNSDFIRNLYRDFYKVEWSLQYGMTNRNNATSRKGNELLISNYNLNEVKENIGLMNI